MREMCGDYRFKGGRYIYYGVTQSTPIKLSLHRLHLYSEGPQTGAAPPPCVKKWNCALDWPVLFKHKQTTNQ